MKELSLSNCRLDKRYDVLQELGRGSYAEIFLARDTLASPQSPHSLVVIKALNVFLQNDVDPDLERTLVENFQNEAIALDRVRHPNIISRLGHGTARDLEGKVFHYLVLEYLAGGDLQKACRESSLDRKTAIGYIEQICAGLRHAHRHGIIHRDIKPQNLLLTKDRSTVKIADFGVARVHISDAPITRVGTNIYAPPEHSPLYAGHDISVPSTDLTPAADVYSLAKTVYTILTGETPRFYANSPITELPQSSRAEDWADDLKRVLNRATLNDHRLRHQSVDEFWSDLAGVRRSIFEGETVTHVRPKFDAVPQPHVARGYTPIAPRRPQFDTSRELKIDRPLPGTGPQKVTAGSGSIAHAVRDPLPAPIPRVEDYWPNSRPTGQPPMTVDLDEAKLNGKNKPKRRRRRMRGLAIAGLLLFLFAGGLYATSTYLRSLGILPEITSPFAAAKMGTANTDINLRPTPSANNAPIGLVTRNSRVRIVKVQNNWYQVDVVQQGRERSEILATNRGWLNGKYVDLDQ